MKELTSKVFLFLFGIVVAFVISEFVIRVFKLAPEVVYIEKWRMRLSQNPKIGYEPIPFLDSAEKSVQFYGYRGLSNDLGFRDRTHLKEKPKGIKRVLVLGDSIVAGLWIDKDSDVYPAILEKKLLEEGENVEVLNFGVSGYNTQQEVETLKDKGISYDPDVVILTYCLNDFYADDGGIYFHLKSEEKSTKDQLNITTLSPVLRKSALFRFFKFRVFPSKKKSESEGLQLPDFLEKDNTASYLKKLASLSTLHGFKVLVTVFPDFDFIDERVPAYNFFSQHQNLKKLAEENDFAFLDLYPGLKKCKEENPGLLLSFDRFHPRPVGNRCVADILKRSLVEDFL